MTPLIKATFWLSDKHKVRTMFEQQGELQFLLKHLQPCWKILYILLEFEDLSNNYNFLWNDLIDLNLKFNRNLIDSISKLEKQDQFTSIETIVLFRP